MTTTVAGIAEAVEAEMLDGIADVVLMSSASQEYAAIVAEQVRREGGRPGTLRVKSPGQRWLGAWTYEELVELLGADDSPLYARLGRSWIVYSITRWEYQHRKDLEGLGVSPNYDLFGDLNKLRNDVVHHGGIASQGNAGRCVTLTFFHAGDEIRLLERHYAEIMDRLAEWVRGLGGMPQDRIAPRRKRGA